MYTGYMTSLRHYMVNTVNEAVANGQFQEAMNIIGNYFKKDKIYIRKDISNVAVEGTRYYGYFVYSCQTMNGCYFLWKQGGASTELSGVMFTSDAALVLWQLTNGGSSKFEVGCDVNGISLAQILPMVKQIVVGKEPMNKKAIEKWFQDHNLYEDLEDPCFFISEAAAADLTALRKRRNNLSAKIYDWKKKGKDASGLEQELADIKRSIAEASMSVHTNMRVDITGDADEFAAQEEEYEERATPEERFSDMEHYINMVIKGLQPSLLICGAPGVGKTYRVMRKVKASGHPYLVIKGKETPLAFYMDLFKMKHKDDILVCDDADDVLTDDTITNLIKAATDSSDERIISYGTSKPPVISADRFAALSVEDQSLFEINEKGEYVYPRSFTTNGSIIIITNRNAGQIDTAVRNRGLVCDLAFTVEECLGLIRDIMPAIMPDKLSVDTKYRALKYLEDLADKGSKMEISIRSFTTTAKVFEDVDDDTQAMRMIKEQMKLQSLRGGHRY